MRRHVEAHLGPGGDAQTAYDTLPSAIALEAAYVPRTCECTR